MAIAHVGDWLGLDAFATRRAVRAELAEVGRWRRLLRARLDLVVASYAPPEVLGTLGWGVAAQAQLALPRPEELTEVVRIEPTSGDAGDRVQLMRRLRDLDRQLAGYQDELERTMEESTERLVAQLAAGGAPDVHGDPR